MKKKYLIGTIIFNLVETYIIFILGYHVGIETLDIVFIMLLFMLSKAVFGKTLHYKQWYKCMIASTCILVTLYFVCRFNEIQSFILTAISSYLMTTRANINVIDFVNENLYHWKSKSKYQPLIDFMLYNYNDPRLINYENYLKTNDILKYNLYDLKFKQNKSIDKINEITNIYDNKKIISQLDSIYETLKYTLCLEA